MPTAERMPSVQVMPLLRRHANTLSGLLLLGVLALAGLSAMRWLSDPVRFPLTVVEVKGEFRYLLKEDLQEAMASFVSGGFFTVNVSAIRAAAEQLPWVYQASVKRVWPATLRVVIVEQQPVAYWGEHGFLNAQGDSFVPERAAGSAGLPRLSGPPGQEKKVLGHYRQVLNILAPLGLQVARVALDERRAWTVYLDNGVELRLGRAEPWQRLQRFVRAYPGIFAGRIAELQGVDLRYSNGFSVLWQELAADSGAGKPGKSG
jgi:cell division protein FtsQ